ncbi:MAG: hypothetical protein CL600_14840 [Alteromonas sp.]|nr:hypothetical protein [Alteromonas sp.]
MKTISQRQTQLTQLLTGELKPRQIIGTGYKYPKSVASAWLRKEIHNEQNPSQSVSDLFVQTNGAPFTSEKKAKCSKMYQQLVKGSFELITRNLIVSDYGVMPAPTSGIDEGYCIYIETASAKSQRRHASD